MDNTIENTKGNDSLFAVAFTLFVIISAWFMYLHTTPGADTEFNLKVWASSYQIVAAFGGIAGLFIANKWGGTKSLMGRSIIFFSVGLLLQVFGQSVNSYHNIFQDQQIPYPSFGDIGFMGSVISYICGAYVLMKASGLRFSVRSISGKFYGIVIPIAVLVCSYFFFLKGYVFDWTNVPKVILDFAYPFGQALYVALAALAFLISRNFLGGIMKNPILFLIFALVFQYFSDFMFLYQANAGTWYAGGLNDFMYFLSYFLMTLALISMLKAFLAIHNEKFATQEAAQ